jgi:hypothetical protein
MSDQSTSNPAPGEQVVNAVKLVADVGVLPGLGQLAEGKVAEGALYGIGGLAAKTILAPMLGPLGLIAWVGLGLDSYSKSSSGRHLWELSSPIKKSPAAPVTVA